MRISAFENGDTAYGFSETIRNPKVVLTPELRCPAFVIVGRARLIAVLSTVSAHQFPVSDGLKLLTTIEQNLADEAP